MDYKVPTHPDIDTYFSMNPISKWQIFDGFINFKLESDRAYTASDLFRCFCRSLTRIEDGSYPKFVTEYAKDLKGAMKQLMRENEIDIREKQSLRAQVSKSKALDDITNAIIGKRKRDCDGDDENNENGHINDETFDNEQKIREKYAMSPFNIKVSSRQIFTWDYVISKIEIKENSMKDWINNGHNFSHDFRQFQKSIIEKLKTDPTLSYTTDIESIIALSSIMILRKNKKPTYITCTDNEWRMAFPHITYKFKMPALIQVTVCSYMQPLMRGDSAEFEDLWRQNWSKVSLLEDQNDKRIFDSMQIITRNFFYNLPYGKNKNLSNKDTYIHRTCHVILEEIFRIENMQLVWANGESSSSKNQRSGDGNAHGLKPDFRLISEDENQSEILFGEIKSPKVENHKFIVNQALAKLANLMKDALDQGIHDETYGVLINGNRIEFWRITLNYNGLYQYVSLVEMTFPTEVAEFLVILSVMERCYELKELVIETEQRSMRNGSSQLSVNYQRDSNSSPMKTKVPIINVRTS
ncbi:hypothetical protein Glove_772g22 [Diversispora epigaea]|uniref:Uncharacterized protein n=1 Tax=Diversispora epigaea TaxID=1348612 RepID=A0A397G3V5_9GLOM|nr:hypothetical protein Glove_772g22 [Diversispora epigaea]